MNIVEKKSSRIDAYNIDYHFKELYGRDFEKLTGKEIKQIIFDDCGRTQDFYIRSYYSHSKRTIWNRINMLWVWPVMLLAAPFSYIFTGDIGVSRNSKIGRIVDWLVKFE